jgi:PAS domain-containing protein
MDPRSFRSSFSPPLKVNKRKILLNLVAVAEGQDFFMIGILQDITLQKNTEDRLAQTLGEFNAVIDTIENGVLLLDSDLKVRIANQAYMDLWQMPRSFLDTRPTMREIIEYTSSSGIYYVAPENIKEYINQRLEAIEQGDITPTEMHRTDGKVLQYRCTILPDNGRLLTYFDITSLKNTEQKLEAALEKVK